MNKNGHGKIDLFFAQGGPFGRDQENLKKVSVSTILAEAQKVSVSKNPKLQSGESLSLDRFENLQSRKVSVLKKQKI